MTADRDSAALTVLLADDSHARLASVRSLLRGLGHEVLAETVSLDEVPGLVAATDPDVSIVAVHGDDEHALALIAEIAAFASGPVIAVLEEDDSAFVARAAELGIYAHAHRPEPEAVQSAIELALRRHREVEQLGRRVDQLQTALDRRATIERAKGILMERHGIGDRAAFELLRSHARGERRTVMDLARAVAEGHTL